MYIFIDAKKELINKTETAARKPNKNKPKLKETKKTAQKIPAKPNKPKNIHL